MAIAFIAFVLLRTTVEAWYAGVEASAANRLITRHAVSFILPLPYAYRDRIARISGVQRLTFATWFSGVYIDKDQFFARLAVDSETFFDVYPEFLVDPEELATFKRERNACIIGTDIARRYNLKIGDIMPVEGDIFPGKWEFVVRGIYRPRDKNTDPSNMLFHWRYIEERMRKEMPSSAGQVGWYISRIDDPANSAAISEAIDKEFSNSRAETKTETEQAFQQNFLTSASAVITAMELMSFVIVAILLLILANTMAMSIRERTHEYAVLKTLGFSGGAIYFMIAGESLILSVAGSGLGLWLTLPAVEGFQVALPKGWFPVFYIKPQTIILGCAAALTVGVGASIIPARWVMRTKIVDGLRHLG